MKFELRKPVLELLQNNRFFGFIKAVAEGTETTEEVTTYEMKGGTKCAFEKMEAGMPIKMADGSAMEDGEYELTDGTKFKVEGGVITEVMPVEQEDGGEKELEIELKALKAKIESLESKYTAKAQELEVIKADSAKAIQAIVQDANAQFAEIAKGIQAKADHAEVIANQGKDVMGMWRSTPKAADPIAEAAVAEWNKNPYEKKFGSN